MAELISLILGGALIAVAFFVFVLCLAFGFTAQSDGDRFIAAVCCTVNLFTIYIAFARLNKDWT